MVTIDGHAGELPQPGSPLQGAQPRHGGWSMRVALILSLVFAAAAGALIAAQLRPAHRAAAVIHVKPPTPTAVPTAAPPASPSRAMITVGSGASIADGAWVTSRAVTLNVTMHGGRARTVLRAEAEILPADLAYSGTANALSTSIVVPARETISVPIRVAGLSEGQQYHWRVRTVATAGGPSAWAGGGVFGVSLTRPNAPALAATNVKIGGWSRIARPVFRIVDTGSVSPISFHEYRIQKLIAGNKFVWSASWTRLDGQVLILPHWKTGNWRVQVRAVDQVDNRSVAATWLFGLARAVRKAPVLLAASPANGSLSNALTASVRWSAPVSVAPIARYEYATTVDATTAAAPTHWTDVSQPMLSLPALPDGDWRVFVRAVDVLGDVSPAAQWRFTLDRERPLLTAPVLTSPSFTVIAEKARLHFGLGKRAAVMFAVYADGAKQPIAVHYIGTRDPGIVRAVVWDGKTAKGTLAPDGSYHIVIAATDAAGNRTVTSSASFTELSKRIVISIAKEALWAYDGKKLIANTLVTNGGPDTPTIPGIFHVEGAEQGLVMHSPWPRSSPLWYPDSPTNFALLYNADGGYFLHDAPWRWKFGPGSNSVAGTPGGNLTGTHGCTNVPYATMAQLFTWAQVGTLIQILP
jgi:hypothetical protein